MTKAVATQPSKCTYFVDEAGDSNIFDRRGRVIIGTEGCSSFFILGVLEVADPYGLSTRLDDLRKQLISDPYFTKIPSMQPEAQKTALAFHAKDDIAEVRREVMAVLRGHHGLKFCCVVTEKHKVLEYVRSRNESDPAYRYNPNELYDYLTRRLFRDRLHKKDAYEIYFSKRGSSDRTVALRAALEAARSRLQVRWKINSQATIQVLARSPKDHPGLQAVDYFNWAVQRLYEKREDRYLEYLWPAFRLVMDIDDKRKNGYGCYYDKRKPLTLAALEGRG